MENKNVGYLLIGISILIIVIIFIFNSALNSFVDASCTIAHGGGYCPMYETIDRQTYLALSIVGILIITGLFLIFSKPNEKIIIRKIKEKQIQKEFNLNNLKKEEKDIFNIIKSNKAIFQADLIEKSGLNKAKITRILDRLEGQGYIERKRRGMNNIVILKDN
ncbi:MAG: MarR family transcriptional regulator [Nanoarchaeota archaeon]